MPAKRLLIYLTLLLCAVSACAATYAPHSVLRQGSWAKIRVAEGGVHSLPDDVIRRAGLDPASVRIFGYGGNLIPEVLTTEWLDQHDDLAEVPQCLDGGRRLFYARGPVHWATEGSARTRNPYSDYGYYFLTSGQPATCSEAELRQQAADDPTTRHDLYEVDRYAYAQTGQLFVDAQQIKAGGSRDYAFTMPAAATAAVVTIVATSAQATQFAASVGAEKANATIGKYEICGTATARLTLNRLDTLPERKAVVTLAAGSGGAVRLDYIDIAYDQADSINLDAVPPAQYVHNIMPQDLHAHRQADLVIIIPTSQANRRQAEELGKLHQQRDGMTYRIVPADELYNEFSSGTPDITAYRRYLKMLYDRGDAPSHVLLFGQSLWDNRMCTFAGRQAADDYLLVYETAASSDLVNSYATDDYITALAGEAPNTYDIAVGRLPASTPQAAQVLVDKVRHYLDAPAAPWQNTLCFVADDGGPDDSDVNVHARLLDEEATTLASLYPGYDIQRKYEDTYECVTTASGRRYPTLHDEIVALQNAGALVINYSGHGSPQGITHEKLVWQDDFRAFRGDNYSLWFAASCETSPFDYTDDPIGTLAIANAAGGAIAFYGATRHVMPSDNARINTAFMRYALQYDSTGSTHTLGEAQRLAKADDTNRYNSGMRQYVLLGDPALRLRTPRPAAVVVDTINGYPASRLTLQGGDIVTVSGHIDGAPQWQGSIAATVYDSPQLITGRNNTGMADEPLTYRDRTSLIYRGTTHADGGRFTLRFRVPQTVNSDGGNARITLTAASDTALHHGECNSLVLRTNPDDLDNDSLGPRATVYMNTPDFRNGDVVGATPFFVAEVEDPDGINAMGTDIGHNMQLTVDLDHTYDLDPTFTFRDGSYTAGQTYYVIPALDPGQHTARFRCWDLLGNMTERTLTFVTDRRRTPQLRAIACYPSPATGNATIMLQHDSQGTDAIITLNVFDTTGRLADSQQYRQTLSVAGNTRLTYNTATLSPGLYLYQVRLRTPASEETTQAQKLIIAH